jgi:PAS domain S-box-containing protein
MPRLSPLRRYSVAALLTLLALSLALLGERTWGPAATYSFFLAAVMLSSWVSGLGPGIMSTVLGTLAADYFLIAPLHTVRFDASRIVQLSAFIATAGLISYLNESRRRAVGALAAERSQLEDHVAQRTAELRAANDALHDEIDRRNRSERNFRGLIDAAPDAILVIDSAGLITKVNDQAERMFGYPREAMVGRNVGLIVPERFPAAHRAREQPSDDAPATTTIRGDFTARRADGTEFPVEIRVSPLDTQGTRSIVGIVRDVTERHRAQQIREQLVHDLGERVKELTALHATGRLLNERLSATEVLTRIVESLPSAWQYAEVAAARIAVADIDVRTPRFERTPWVQRAAFRSRGGVAGVIEVAYVESRPDADEGPFLAEERNLIESIASMLQAYLERQQAEEDRVNLARAEAARLEAQAANAAKDQFLATLSHELRSPLNVMLGWTQMLRSGQMSAESTPRGWDILERSVRLQTKLIDDLLDVSRIIAGKLNIDKRRVDLATIVGLAVDAARPAARSREIHLSAAIAPSLPVDADPQRLQQVVSNLLTNALKFTPEHGSIAVVVERSGQAARLTVQDSGIGMSAELVPRVFDRFQQGDSSTTRAHGGLGLGLAIVRHLVEQHGGRIEAASAGHGRGSTFTVTLPLLPAEAPSLVAPASSIDRSLLSGVRVLVVEDDHDARTSLAAILEQFGAQPTVVGSARAAYEAVVRNCPDVLLSDIAMPEEDGYALIRRIRGSMAATHLPAVAMSAYADGGAREQALDAGFQVYLAKPVEPTTLAATLATLVHGTVHFE